MSAIDVVARLAIHAGKFEAFRAAAAACLDGVRAHEPGALRYEWFVDADRSECVVLERYRDSQAVLDHVANLGPRLDALLATCDARLELYGPVSAELRAATAGLQPAIFERLQGL